MNLRWQCLWPKGLAAATIVQPPDRWARRQCHGARQQPPEQRRESGVSMASCAGHLDAGHVWRGAAAPAGIGLTDLTASTPKYMPRPG